MNLHVVQNELARAEIRCLMSVPEQIVTPQSNRPIIGMVQDGCVGAYLLSRRDTFLAREDVMQLVMQMDKGIHQDVGRLLQEPALQYKDPVTQQWRQLWTGKQLISLLFPPDFHLDRFVRNGTPDTENDNRFGLTEKHVIVRRGYYVAGSLCKQTVGSSGGGIVHLLCNDYSSHTAANFLNDMQRVVNLWLADQGFSARYSDCLIDQETEQEIQQIMQAAFDKVSLLENNPLLPWHMKEHRAQNILAGVRDKAGLLVTRKMGLVNGIGDMATSGSKGSSVNSAQIKGVVAQQSVNGCRIGVNSCGRAMAYFPRDAHTSLHPVYRGFVTNSFLKGLTPMEYFFHAMGGREGLIDTSCKTVPPYPARVSV